LLTGLSWTAQTCKQPAMLPLTARTAALYSRPSFTLNGFIVVNMIKDSRPDAEPHLRATRWSPFWYPMHGRGRLAIPPCKACLKGKYLSTQTSHERLDSNTQDALTSPAYESTVTDRIRAASQVQ